MPNIRTLSRSFAAGEITPELFGRVDLDQFQTGLALCRNCITLPHGPAVNRAGTAFVIETQLSTKKSRVIPFTYSTTQTMVLEFGDRYLRFHTGGGTLLEPSIPAIVAGGVVNATNSYSGGEWVFIQTATASVYGVVRDRTANTFRLTDPPGNYLDLSTVNGPATAARVYTIPTPYVEADLFDLHYVQSADVMTVTHPNYPSAELRRLGAANWTLTNISFVSSMTPPTGVGSTAVHGSTGTPNYIDYVYLVT